MNTIESSLDHIYISKELSKYAYTRKSDESSMDHVPIFAGIENNGKQWLKEKIVIKICTRDLKTE